MIYFDNSATTKPYKEVLDTFITVSQKYFANPSSLHSKGGEAENLLTAARKSIAGLLDVDPSEIVFTSGGTEGNNIAIKGIAFQHQNRGKHVITTAVEHPSSYESFQYLETQGFDITYLPVDEAGLVSIEDLKKAIRPETILVSMLHVNNETGTIQPIKEIGEVVKEHKKIFFHVDNVQGIAKVPLPLKEWGIDLCTISAHKVHGLKGTGLLYVKNGVTLSALFTGGEQEHRKRAGTENVAGIASMAKALRLTMDAMRTKKEKLLEVKQTFFEGLKKIEGVTLNTPEKHSAPHIINFSVEGIKPEVLIHSLDKRDIYVSTRSACSSKQGGASRVLLEMGHGEKRASTAIRISTSYDNTVDEAKTTLNVLEEEISNIKKVMR
ncbi:cysteine desulfurase family protein [Fictibacillus phosphorivorans]|uniref:cysteine desulfurase family protein n=1 Tax=Fictibacillus phosphorivorans TaxID=1221500 RepID=UPI002041DD28|nr:cysteine desulfurase family protein [Fictibacillus phosphorivorans]MCM3717951.1 cysteine desulfurase [Fictibacillus phosphorivorans]MCM3775400.1 cysteine desulfurase [Fictibacillus phosphorivorans]